MQMEYGCCTARAPADRADFSTQRGTRFCKLEKKRARSRSQRLALPHPARVSMRGSMLPLLVAAANAWPRDDRLYAEEERVLFAGGCFWSVELAFQRVPGVIRTAVGYAGGHTLSPVTYQAVVTGTTGHAETVEVVYDPQRVSFERLVDLFWQLHDPTSLNQQGGDAGTQYRSAIFYTSEGQRAAVAASLARLPPDVGRRVVTQVASATAKGFLWEPAEGYHRAPPPTPRRVQHACVRTPVLRPPVVGPS